MKYEEWLNEWFDNIKPTVKEHTFLRYRQTAQLHILPKLGQMELSEIKLKTLQSFMSDLATVGNKKTGQGLSASFMGLIAYLIKSSLKDAFDQGLIAEDEASKLRHPKIIGKQVDCFTLAEQKKIVSYVLSSKKDKTFGIVLSMYTGLRIGELLALKWSDLDLSKGLLTVSRTCYDGHENGKRIRIYDTPKTETSNRTIPIPKQFLPKLREIKRSSDSEFVINEGSKTIYIRSYQKMFEGMLKKLNIKHRGFHALRHTFATRATECGMDTKSLSEILGHKNPAITLKVYTHSRMEHKVELMNRLGKLL